MSNYARFIVVWSGTDELAGDSEARRAAILERYQGSTYDQKIRSTLVDRDMACEVVLVGSANYFEPARLLATLRTFEWSDPGEVELFWKDEEDDLFSRASFNEPPKPDPFVYGGGARTETEGRPLPARPKNILRR